MSLLTRLKDRKLVQWAPAYLAGAWVLLEATDFVAEYADQTKNLREIAAELGVNNVLEGSVRRAGGRVRITVQLIDARTDEHLWAESYDRDLSDIFAIQSDVATQVAERLEAALAPAVLARLASPPTRELDAYDAYLAGRQNVRSQSVEGLERAVRFFEEAVAIDPEFAEAHSGLADAA